MKALVFTILLFLGLNSYANDSIQFKIFIINGIVKHNLFFYPLVYPKGENLIYQVKTNGKKITNFQYKIPEKKREYPVLFFIYIKHKYFFGGRWVEVMAPPYEEGKNLVIFFSNMRKRKYCYDTRWTDEDDIMYID